MKNVKTHRITQEGLDNLVAELKERSEEKRLRLRDTVDLMRERGDRSENEGYTLAIEEFESNERRIAELQILIDTAEIVQSRGDKVGTGSKVKVRVDGKEQLLQIVGPNEANPLDNKVSNVSPIGAALMGKKVGDKVSIELPLSKALYEILSID